jgi:hypothetical protein
MDKVEFLSPQWVQLFRSIVEQGLAEADLSGIEYCMYEMYKNVPAHLRREGSPDLAFGLRISGGRIDFLDGPVDNADFIVVADYDSMARWVCLTHAETKQKTGVEWPAIRSQLIAAGKLQVSGVANFPACLRSLQLHDRLAVRTTSLD